MILLEAILVGLLAIFAVTILAAGFGLAVVGILHFVLSLFGVSVDPSPDDYPYDPDDPWNS